MADLNHYRLKAIGPATALAGVEDSAVSLMAGNQIISVKGQSLSPQFVANRTLVPELTYTDLATMHAPAFSTSASFGLHFIAQDSAGGDGTGIISLIANAFLVPQSVSGNKTGPASTSVRAMFQSGLTVGTTTKTLGTATGMYVMGQPSIAGATLDGVESVQINFGLDVWHNAGQGGTIYATQMLYRARAATITIVTTDLDVVSSYITPAAVTVTACEVPFATIANLATGYKYTLAKAFIAGRIQGGNPPTGTLTLTPYGGEILAGASY